MSENSSLQELVFRAKTGDTEALSQIVYRFNPAIKKYGRQLGHFDICSDLAVWIINAVYHYKV